MRSFVLCVADPNGVAQLLIPKIFLGGLQMVNYSLKYSDGTQACSENPSVLRAGYLLVLVALWSWRRGLWESGCWPVPIYLEVTHVKKNPPRKRTQMLPRV